MLALVQKRKKKQPQSKYTVEDRYKIAKYAKDHGPNQAARCFHSKYPTIRESTVRSFLKKYNEQVRIEKTLNQLPAERITNLTRGRSLMVGPAIDEKVRKFLIALFKKGGHISYGITSTTANVLLSRSEDLSLKNIKTTPMWRRSILQRLGFRRRIATTGKVEVPEGARKEAGLQHHFRIVNIIEKHNIAKSLVLNSDQTPSKYVTVGLTTMAPKNSTRVGLAGSTDKRSITLTLTVTLDRKIFPFQIIYGGKTHQSLPKITFPAKFSTSVNEKHYSNTEEVIKHLQEIVIP